MDNIRSGNMYVVKMKSEIVQSLKRLKCGCINKRAQRQLVDGANFWEMIEEFPYCQCKTISELKKEISKKRNELKEEAKNLECYLPGYRYTLFDEIEEVTDEQLKEIERRNDEITRQLRWLHKCLGMCSSRSYFK